MPDFHEVGPLTKIAILLLHGWGYSYYSEKDPRADERLVRTKIGWLLGSARKSLEEAERAYRREHLPPPSREKPRHDPAAVAGAQLMERLSKAVGALVASINNQPVPDNAHIAKRRREEPGLLQRLIDSDQLLTGQAELLRSLLAGKDGTWMLENEADVQDGIKAINETLRQRQALLFSPA